MIVWTFGDSSEAVRWEQKSLCQRERVEKNPEVGVDVR